MATGDRPDERAVIDRRTLNRTLLARQRLLERVETPPLEVVEHLVGMQAQVPLDPYTGLWSRVRDFDPEAFGRALLDRRLVRMTLMRATLHLVTAADAQRLRPPLQVMLERAFAASPFARELAGVDPAQIVARGIELVEGEPLTVARLGAALSQEWPDRTPDALAYAVRYLVPVVQVTPRGVWGQAMRPTVTTLRSWLDGIEPTQALSVDEVVLRYLRAFGPATSADIRAWSGLTDVQAVVARLRPRLRSYRDETGRALYDVADGTLADPGAPAPVRFLPQYDNVLLSHADRGRVMDAVRWGTSFAHRGSFLVDGFLAGAWKLDRQGREATLLVEARTPLRGAARADVRGEAERLLVFLTPHARTRRVSFASA